MIFQRYKSIAYPFIIGVFHRLYTVFSKLLDSTVFGRKSKHPQMHEKRSLHSDRDHRSGKFIQIQRSAADRKCVFHSDHTAVENPHEQIRIIESAHG